MGFLKRFKNIGYSDVCLNLQAPLKAESSRFQTRGNNSLIERLWAEIGFWTIIYSASEAFLLKKKTIYKSPILSYLTYF